MSHSMRPTSYQERLQICELTSAGHSDARAAQQLARSPWTCRKWRRRYQKDGPSALASKMGRPPSGVFSTFSPDLAQSVLALRQAHPGWGGQTIRLELAQLPEWQLQPLPSCATFNRFLKAHNLIAPRKSLAHATPLTSPTQPHQVWEMDAQGELKVEGLGKVAPINLIDGFSRLKVESYPTMHSRQPTLADYQLALRRAFIEHGLPQRLSLDHGPIFYDNSTAAPFPTRFILWLIALGIQVEFSRKGRPTDHAKVERLHQTLEKQALLGQSFAKQFDLWQALDERRRQLNAVLPCRSLAGLAPLQAYPQAEHSGREYRIEWESEILNLELVEAHLAQQPSWFRQIRPTGTVWLGGYEYYVSKAYKERAVAISYELSSHCLLFKVEGDSETLKAPIQGIKKEALMGEMAEFKKIADHQLSLPISPQAWRELQYINKLF